jgi:murein DD-endopeptidase MepM/ murein hydrolase activator NlpD
MTSRIRFNPVAAAIATVTALAAVTAVAVAPRTAAELPREQMVREEVAMPVVAPESVDRFIQTERVRRGDTFASLLARLGAFDLEFQRFVATHPVARKILQLKAGRTVLAELDDAGRILKFSYRLNGLDDNETQITRAGRRVLIQRDGDQFSAREEEAVVERAIETRATEIRTTLFAATIASGIPDSVAGQLDDVFGLELDVHKDLRRGDKVRVVYETLREAGSFDTPVAGRVLAAEIVTGGVRHEAAWFERAAAKAARPGRGEYYTFSGQGLKKAFLRNPVEVSAVMSGFTQARLHPVMRDWRAHKGVDFAAPTGTKVRSVGDGTVEFIGQQRGYGNVVIVKHPGDITTLYAHLSDFVDGLTTGSRISQGDIVGYVGQTGWATGPHLHYEFRIHGEQTNPLTVALPQAHPLDAVERQRFAALVQGYRTELARIDQIQVARFQ